MKNYTVESFNEEFERNSGQLKSYLLRITASVRDAEDIVHDTYIKAVDKLNTFRGESSLKTWLFTIAYKLAKDNLRVQKRWTENVTDITKAAALRNKAFFVPEVPPKQELLTLVGSSNNIFHA